MGFGWSAPLRYEGYGKDKDKALHALDSLIRFHYNEASVRKQEHNYYVWDGIKRYNTYFDESRNQIRAFIYF